ncbi:adenine deaminase [uncultured Methanobrevibacter sp.]|uniref:adenine deaminase n=1 Tax=uncultured Methanobrevibacter sp. TaxID=253161 RepID=UPI0025DDEEF8|nr:adenine deaminase [uncultured Methanobrevibacter sp.]
MQFTSYILDVLTDSVYPARITIEDGIFKEIVPIQVGEETEMDVEGLMLPGFIDSHIHIESSMMTPAQFAKVAVRHGTTAVVCDPHEIANVHGIDGVEFMIENASTVPFNFYFAAPSCVPATSFETSGAVLDSDDIEYLLQKPEVVALAEMMNFPGVIGADEEVLEKLRIARKYNKPIDGHAPLVSGKELDKYIEQGIVTDHECSNFLEAIEKKQKGMKIMVRDGSSAKDMDALFDFSQRIEFFKNQDSFGIIPTEVLSRRLHSPIFDFIVSDDKNPRDLVNGHLNESVKKAVDLGVDLIKAIEMVTINPAAHYGLDGGSIVTGSKADFIIVDNLDDLNVLKTYISGECVFDGENVLFDVEDVEVIDSMNVDKKSPEDFNVYFDGDECEVNVIQCFDGELLTKKTTARLITENGIVQPDIFEDVLKIAVVERHGSNNVANAFIKGFGLKKGAIAASIAHDSHNIVAIGYSPKRMAEAVNRVIENKGGIAVVSEDFADSLSLPIAGLMSNQDGIAIAKKLRILQKMAFALGCELTAPFMTMAFMSLLVIPSIKLSDKGLFDGDSFEFIDVIRN